MKTETITGLDYINTFNPKLGQTLTFRICQESILLNLFRRFVKPHRHNHGGSCLGNRVELFKFTLSVVFTV